MAALLSAALAAPPAAAQAFGQNQVRIRDFDWKAVDTAHFRIHYYGDSAPLVPYAAGVLERSYEADSKALGVSWTVKKPFFLYADVNAMEQSTIVDVGDGTGGVTEPFKDRFMVYADGTRQWLDDVVSHELTHVFQYDVWMSGKWRSGRILKSIVYPLWFVEGMAEYYSRGRGDTQSELVVRDAATSDGLIPLWKLEHFGHLKPHQVRLAYELGESAVAFLDDQYGTGTVPRMLRLFDSRFDVSSVLGDVTGLDIFAFDRKWREFETDEGRRSVRLERLREPDSYGPALTRPQGGLPQFDTSPVYTPDGHTLAWLSTRDGYPPQVLARDLRTGRTRTLMGFDSRVESIMLGKFVNLSRVLAVSPDGRTLAFAGTKNHRDSIWLCDLRTGRLRRLRVPGFETVDQPAYSPDGRSLAFSGVKDGMSDLWLLDLASGR
ncbi:MAG: PD40 domain-containing protein, partial [Elusimicrobia bacterium]|nr:PD40 domain-containing protein [Elusimicrobiota bacterium]